MGNFIGTTHKKDGMKILYSAHNSFHRIDTWQDDDDVTYLPSIAYEKT